MLGLGKLGDLGNLMKGAQEMQKKIAEVQEKLADLTTVGESGGGLVRVVSNGRQEIIEVKIDPSLLGEDDNEILEDLVVAATNHALSKARDLAQQEMQGVLGGLPPELRDMAGLSGPSGA